MIRVVETEIEVAFERWVLQEADKLVES